MRDRATASNSRSSPAGGTLNTSFGSVDVLIAARNRSDTIKRAVTSALAQTDVRNVILIDDGSTDDTAALALQCDTNSDRLIVERLSSNVGPSAARNIAIEISTAPWLAILDGDDYFLPGRIGALLSKADACDFLADDILQIGEDQVGVQEPIPVLFDHLTEHLVLTLEQFVLGNVKRHGLLRRELGFLKPLVRRSFLDQHQLRYDETLRLGEDYVLYARALALGARFLVVPAQGYVSVVRRESLSAHHCKQDLERLRDCDNKLIATSNLTAAERRVLAKHYLSMDCRVQWLVVIEAAKSRQYAQFLAAFCRSPKVSFFLLARLFEEVRQRSRKLLRDNR